nr:MAG TPA: hypothetical protein [Caudoviricetes sp.]
MPPIYRPILIGGSLSHYAKRRRYPLTSSRAQHCQSSSRALPRQNRHYRPRPHSGHYAHTPKNAAT